MEDYWKEHLEYTYKKNIYSSTARRLLPNPSLITHLLHSIYIRIPFYLHTESLLFIYILPSIYIRELYHRHTGEIELSS